MCTCLAVKLWLDGNPDHTSKKHKIQQKNFSSSSNEIQSSFPHIRRTPYKSKAVYELIKRVHYKTV